MPQTLQTSQIERFCFVVNAVVVTCGLCLHERQDLFSCDTVLLSMFTSGSEEMKPDFRPIGFVKSPVTEAIDMGWGSVISEVQIESEYASGLEGLQEFSHAVIVTWLHLAEFDRSRHLQRRPRDREDMPLVGMFAQRARHRPNSIGITTVEIIDVKPPVLRVQGLDAIDGTPVLDVRPYFPAYDRVDDARVPEWVDRLMQGYF